MTRIPDAVAVASLDTHRLIITVPNDGPAEVSSSLPRPVAATVLRQLADRLDRPAEPCGRALATGEPCPVHDPAESSAPLTADDVRGALDFNAVEHDQVLATVRDVLLDTFSPRGPEQALAAARILLDAHARQIAALIEAHYSTTRTRRGLNRSTRGVLTGYEGARKLVTAYADGLAAEQGAQR